MALEYPKNKEFVRLFTDDENHNKRFYRESEAHAKIFHDCEQIRENMGFEKLIYEEPHDPDQVY